ncbi:hypothetical protein [Sphingomonas sp.]|uniref:hypothetical protein n=1 Tax=Sphingomonas sp. TaxID=28214 RepID=UPI00286C703C|nr:hypothetical protein [Sphingomonas sp.]
MTAPVSPSRLSWSARLLIGLTLLILGAAATVWALAHYQRAARFLGVTPSAPATIAAPQQILTTPAAATSDEADAAAVAARIAGLEARLSSVENAARRAEGSAGRTDALVVAFATRRAIDRGVSLGYLETLLVDRFGTQHPRAVATIVTVSRAPVRLDELTADYEKLGPALRGGGPQDSWWLNFRREMGSLVAIRRADVPSAKPNARYMRALSRLESGDVDNALAETMRLPGAPLADAWVANARRYVAAHRALDEIESAALLSGSGAER